MSGLLPTLVMVVAFAFCRCSQLAMAGLSAVIRSMFTAQHTQYKQNSADAQ